MASGAVAVAFVAVFFAVAGTLDPVVEVERSLEIAAEVEKVFPLVNNLKNWEQWSPWKEADPEMEVAYRGPEEGAGAVSTWRSAKRGSGEQVVVTSVPDRQVELAQDFGEDGTAAVEFLFEEAAGGGTRVTWKMEADLAGTFLGRFLAPAARSEMGRAYERGLQNLKRVAEAGATPGS